MFTGDTEVKNNSLIEQYHPIWDVPLRDTCLVRLYSSSDNTLYNNTCIGSAYGIYLENSPYTQIIENNCTRNCIGIYVSNSDYTEVTNNTLTAQQSWLSSEGYGIRIEDSDFVEVIDNNCLDNEQYGIVFEKSYTGLIAENVCINHSYGGILLYKSNATNLRDNTCLQNKYGMIFSTTGNHVVKGTLCTANGIGMVIGFTRYLRVTENNFSYNLLDGIMVHGADIRIDRNLFWGNLVGVRFYPDSRDCLTEDNLFVENLHSDTSVCYNAYDEGLNNIYTSNYWSDYTGPDEDGNGIGDVPYTIKGNAASLDEKPWMLPPGALPVWL
ncbi:MAG: NosD domain-containing protein, partial [Promethearchaeota archaeon]